MPESISKDIPACLDYAEMGLTSFANLFKLAVCMLGPVPVNMLDIGHGLAHLVISASASQRCVQCDCIEIGQERFIASLQTLEIAAKNEFVKTSARVLKEDVLKSEAIQLNKDNLYVFFDKVCKPTSQELIQNIILQQIETNFQLGPIVYCTCMGEHYLEQALLELKNFVPQDKWDRLLIDAKSFTVTLRTRFAGQNFTCNLVKVWQRPKSPSIMKMLTSDMKKRVTNIWGPSILHPARSFLMTDLIPSDFNILKPLSVNADNLTSELNDRHMSEWKRQLNDVVEKCTCDV